MKDEEFNDFLRDRAEQFEMKPSSGSFGAVMGKMRKKRKKTMLWFLFPMLLVSAVGGYLFMGQNNPQGIQGIVVTTNPNELAFEGQKNTITDNKLIAPNQSKEDVKSYTKQLNVTITNQKIIDNKVVTQISPSQEIQSIHNEETKIINEPKLSLSLLASKKPLLPIYNIDNSIYIPQVALTLKAANPIKPGKKIVVDNCEEKNAFQISYTQYNVGNGNVNTDVPFKENIAVTAKTIFIGQGIPNYKQTYPPVETYQTSWTGGFGINAAYRGLLGKRSGLQAGLSYSVRQNKQNINEYTEYWDTASVERTDPITNLTETVLERSNYWVNSASTQYTSRLQTLSIPLTVYYKLGTNCKWGWEISGGASFNYLAVATTSNNLQMGNSSFMLNNTGQTTYRKVTISAMAGISGNYYFTKKMGVFSGLRIESPLHSVYQSNPPKSTERLVLWGFETGVRFKF